MMAYTPGEWKVVGQRQALIADPKLELTIVKPDDRAIAIVLVERGLEDEALDNAALIAAAPDLLEALEPLAWLARVMEPNQILNHRGVYITYEQAQAAADAMAKATNDHNDSR